jgi:hypothetical protein
MGSSYVSFFQASSFDIVTVTIVKGHQQGIENCRLIPSNNGHRELLWSFKNINKLS